MAITTFNNYTGDVRNSYVISGALSSSHIRVWVGEEQFETGWNLLSSVVLFDEDQTPTDVKIYVSSDGSFPVEYIEPSDVQIVADNIINSRIPRVYESIDAIDDVAEDLNDPSYSHILNANANATASQLRAWEAEAGLPRIRSRLHRALLR